MSKILVIIPYCAEGAQGRELELALDGWQKHFKEDYTIMVVGDWSDAVLNRKDVFFVNCPRITHPDDGNYLPHLDHVNKFKRVLHLFNKYDGFIYACDDMYAVRDFTLKDVQKLKYLEDDMGGDFLSGNAWDRDMAKTRNLCVKNGLPLRNWVCHLPVYYDKKKLFEIFEKYDCANNSCVLENVYFNTYHAKDKAVLIDDKSKYRFALNRKNVSTKAIEDAIKNRIWIVNSPLGWSDRLEKLLLKHYENK